MFARPMTRKATFFRLQKIGMPRVSGSIHSSLGQSKAQFLAKGFDIEESGSKRF